MNRSSPKSSGLNMTSTLIASVARPVDSPRLSCKRARGLSEAHPSLNGIDQFLRVVSLAIFEDNLDVFYVVDFLAGIAFDDD